MDRLIDFGYVVHQTQHNGPRGPNKDPVNKNCTNHSADPPHPDCQREYDFDVELE
jgi:hypothetical protein